jgi:hypothetical protein
MFLGLLDPDSLFRGMDPIFKIVRKPLRIRIQEAQKHTDPTDPDPSVIKIVRKTLIPTVLLLLFDLSLKNVENVLSKSNKQKNFFF